MRKVCRYFIAILTTLMVLPELASGDTIVIDGKRYENVLVNEGATTYYVRVPDEGKIISAKKESVDAASVVTNKDPFYRAERKERYEAVREAGGSLPPEDRVFEGGAVAGSGGGLDASGLLGGGGGTFGGVTKSQVISQMNASSPIQIQFQPTKYKGQPASKGTLPPPINGSITLVGPGDQLTGIAVQVNAPEQMVTLMVTQSKSLMGAAAGQFDALLNKAKANGSATESVDGANIKIIYKANGPNINYSVEVMGS